MSVSIDIKRKLISLIEGLDSVQKVYGFEEPTPTGWPAVFIKPADMQGEFSSTAENSRIYAYTALILFPIGQDFIPPTTQNRLEYAEEVVATVIDEIINVTDTNIELTGSNDTVRYINAADVQWGEYGYEGGVAKAALLTLRVYTDITVV